MARSVWLTLAFVGLSTAAMTFAFPGCGSIYDDVSTGKGNCEDDKNPCTIDDCRSGATMHNPVAEGQPCTLGANAGTCDKEGMCQLDCLANGGACKCAANSECPTDEACATWACTMGTCTRTAKADNEIVGTLEAGDCKHEICTAGTKNTVQDDKDTPDDTAGDCQKWTCENEEPKSIADDMDTPPDSKGDCKKPVCSNGMPSTANDNTDEPDDSGCVNNSCLNGMVSSTNAMIGTQCATGVCNLIGACVDCLSASEWMTCGGTLCKAKKCNAETCAMAGECKSSACADGVCCDTACTDECKSCAVSGSVGACTNLPYYQEDMSYGAAQSCDIMVAGAVCDGQGKCLKTSTRPCQQNGQCISNTCVAGKCKGAPGEFCNTGTDCVSGMCMMGACK